MTANETITVDDIFVIVQASDGKFRQAALNKDEIVIIKNFIAQLQGGKFLCLPETLSLGRVDP